MTTATTSVTYEQCTEYEIHHFVTEASDLGLRGPFPHSITTDMGNKQPFLVQKVIEKDGDLAAVEYRQEFGCLILCVLND